MYRFLTPILALIVAIALFFTFIEPQYAEYQKVGVQVEEYSKALESAAELERRISELKRDRDNIEVGDQAKLDTFLPKKIDSVKVVMLLDKLAETHDLSIGQISVGGRGQSAPAQGKTAFSDTDEKQKSENDSALAGLEPLPINFSLTGKYKNYRAFMLDAEKSLGLIDITNLSIGEMKVGDISSFTVTIAMYQYPQVLQDNK
jgi:hypothetical protein